MIYYPPSLDGFFPRNPVASPWMDHWCFGYDIVHALRPSLVVELGTEAGSSYFCLCQSVQENEVEARCYAVDTWLGDRHTGPYGEQIYREVSRYNAGQYAGFSTLFRMRFEEAVHSFEDASIELLHIDGLHTYAAVRSDFETWFPKVKPGGVILFHDVRTRAREFGAWLFWEEIRRRYESFTFNHGYGLGVLRKPGGSARNEPLLTLLFESDARQRSDLRAFYVHAADFVGLVARKRFREKIRERRQQERHSS